MKLRIIYLIILFGTFFALVSCSDDDIDPKNLKQYENVAIVYWIGDNSLSSFAEDDIQELSQGKDNIPADSKIVIYADKANQEPTIYELDAANGLKVWKKYPEKEDCTDSLTLLTNLKTIVKNFPAKHYGLTFGSHGNGWIWQRRALGPDESHGSKWLNVPTLRGVLEQLPHLEYIFFDVCFMQCIEVTYELRNVTDWVIGSPAEIPNPGAPYHIITAALCKGDVRGIIEGYDSYYPITVIGSSGNEKIVQKPILSAVKCEEQKNFAALTSTYIKKYFANRQTISSYTALNIQKYSSFFSSYTYCYDMNSAMYNILTADDYAQWAEQFEKAVPLRWAGNGTWSADWCLDPTIYDPEHFGGISMYIPQNTYGNSTKNADLQHYQWYKAVGWDQTGW